MRVKGYFTVEAAVVFTFITSLVVSIVNLDFLIHDRIINDSGKILAGMKYREARLFCVNSEDDTIHTDKVICSPVFGEDEDMIENSIEHIDKRLENYFSAGAIGTHVVLSGIDIATVITENDNANVVRAGGKLVQVIGGNDNEN